jgi:hypothetical protein
MAQLLSEWLTVRNTLAYCYVTGENTLAFCVNVSDEEKSLKTLGLLVGLYHKTCTNRSSLQGQAPTNDPAIVWGLTVTKTLAYCYVTGENTLAFCVNFSDEETSFKTLTL